MRRAGSNRTSLSHPASCLPSLVTVLLPVPLTVRLGIGTMKALTPARLTRAARSPRLHCLAFPTFRPQPREPSAGRFIRRCSASGWFQASPPHEQARHRPPLNRVRQPPPPQGQALRTVASSPVAPHPALLLAWPTQLPSTTELRHPPARTCTVPTWQLHGRTHGRACPGHPCRHRWRGGVCREQSERHCPMGSRLVGDFIKHATGFVVSQSAYCHKGNSS